MPDPEHDDEDDRTVIRPARRAAPAGHTLPVGTVLEGMEITGLIGEGGFGIVYLGWDAQLERRVAIKEYMPSSLAARESGTWHVTIRSERHRETFQAGLRSFVNEARLLARFDHPALVKVYRFWQANDTAYMAMPYYEGPTLKSALAQLGGPPDEALLREWMRPLLDALSVMHKEQCYHRDIAPDNILLTARGPLLLDFGAARRVIGDMTHALTVVLKPGYAPIEQYGESAAMAQGAWTDLYALASVVHYAILGKAPISSVERMMGDRLRPLAEIAAGQYSAGFLHAIDTALSLQPEHRPQDVAQFRELLNAGLPADSPDRFLPSTFEHSAFHTSGFSPSAFDGQGVDVPLSGLRARTVAPTSKPATVAPTQPPPPAAVPPTAWRDLRTAAPAVAPVPVTASPAPSAAPAAAPVGSSEASAARPVPPALVIAVALVVLAAAGGTAWWMRHAPTEPPPSSAATPAPAPAPVRPAAPAAVDPAPAAATPAPPPVATAPVAAEPPAAIASEPVVAVPPPPAPTPATTVIDPPMAAPPTAVAAPQPPPAQTRPARAAHPEVAPPSTRARPARCGDILQKASLEPLTPEESAFLKRECR